MKSDADKKNRIGASIIEANVDKVHNIKDLEFQK